MILWKTNPRIIKSDILQRETKYPSLPLALHICYSPQIIVKTGNNPAKYLGTWKKQFDRLQLGTAPIPNIFQQCQYFSLFPDTEILVIIEVLFLSVLKKSKKDHIHDSISTIKHTYKQIQSHRTGQCCNIKSKQCQQCQATKLKIGL